ncbi:predicted protein [Uncinocarpus reesii 1704]|uniref:Uncharacterized protein n=1 Tax=Uncinocarpus reesii (strain UAMH 1704) TaxID=336963 RepID=C4JSR1_UNCRE|nr:uncharacterized protein UREG_05500 [Uncinocarpus reesii 1704]EEP80658.1 predicted protein [Uncinocarpus reesii 1704]
MGIESIVRRAHYSDGVYAALSSTVEVSVPIEPSDEQPPDPQELYYNLLRHRFQLLRSTLKCAPPAEAIEALDAQHPISLPDDSKHARQEWRWLLQTVDPHMVQIACMHPEDVLRVLTLVTRSISDAVKSGEVVRVKRLAAWAWGLLARCREVGEMGSEEVADIRELGKRAVKILLKVREVEEQDAVDIQQNSGENGENVIGRAAEDISDQIECEDMRSKEQQNGLLNDYPMVDTGSDPVAQVDDALANEKDELEEAKARLQARLASTFSDDISGTGAQGGSEDAAGDDEERNEREDQAAELRKQTRAMLDMIISISGEFYGQSDLLEFRDLWEEGDRGWVQ